MPRSDQRCRSCLHSTFRSLSKRLSPTPSLGTQCLLSPLNPRLTPRGSSSTRMGERLNTFLVASTVADCVTCLTLAASSLKTSLRPTAWTRPLMRLPVVHTRLGRTPHPPLPASKVSKQPPHRPLVPPNPSADLSDAKIELLPPTTSASSTSATRCRLPRLLDHSTARRRRSEIPTSLDESSMRRLRRRSRR